MNLMASRAHRCSCNSQWTAGRSELKSKSSLRAVCGKHVVLA